MPGEENPSLKRKKWFSVGGWALFLVLWVALVLAIYYAIHKPWQPEQLAALGKSLLDVFLACALTTLAGGLGRRVIGALGGVTPLERLSLQAALGFGILALGWLALGVIGLLQLWLGWAVLLAGWLVLLKDIRGWLGELRFLGADHAGWSFLNYFALGFFLLSIGLNLFTALAPPLKWDALVYHLELPRRYLQAGQVVFIPANLYGGFPQLVEMLFSWAMLLGSDGAAVVLGWMAGLIALLGAEGMARRLAGPQVTWLSPAFLLMGWSISQALSWGYVDPWVMLFGSLVVVALDYHRLTGSWRWLVWAGLMAGFAIGVKYTSGIMILVGGLVLLPIWDRSVNRRVLSERSRMRWREFFRDALLFSGLAFLTASPWLLKNGILAGNPFYPVFFEGQILDPWRQFFQSAAPQARTLLNDLLLPLEVTWFGIQDAVVVGKPEYGASLGPMLLALIPGLLVGWNARSRESKSAWLFLFIAVGVVWVLWAIAAHFANQLLYPRHYYGIFPALAVLAAGGFQSLAGLKWSQVRIGRLLNALVILAIVLSGLGEFYAFARIDPLAVLTGYQDSDEYVKHNLGWYGPAMQAVNALPGGSRVLFLWEPRVYYCQVDCLTDATLHNWWYWRRLRGDSHSIASDLNLNKVTHVLINDRGVQMVRDSKQGTGYEAADWEELDRFVDMELEKVTDIGGQYSLYALRQSSNEP